MTSPTSMSPVTLSTGKGTSTISYNIYRTRKVMHDTNGWSKEQEHQKKKKKKNLFSKLAYKIKTNKKFT